MINQTLNIIGTQDNQQIAVWHITDDEFKRTCCDVQTNNQNNSNKKQNLLFIHGAFSDKSVCLGIASYFASLGHQCFIMEWRGHGASAQPKMPYHLEDVAFFDVKATFHYLLDELNLDNLHCITHSGGGICLTMFLTRHPEFVDKISSMTMFACQAFAAANTPSSYTKLLLSKAVTRQIGIIKGKSLNLGTMNESYYLLSQWMDWNLNRNFSSYVSTPISQQLAASAQVIAKPLVKPVLNSFVKPLVKSMAKPVPKQARLNVTKLARSNSRPKDTSPPIDYRSLMPNITVPIYSICGTGDSVAPPRGCLKYLQAFKNSKNQFREFGTAHGNLENYNHTRIFLSRNAATEVWPSALDWIERNSKEA
ncbi:alpha/beta fold hydrolase [Psychrobacter sp.]|uniref:alpha/beta fold hydrolase n=1 Tax=Psychrobacter sp. TaxID=56811 RepID=UPI0025D8EC96|nr:alpha/beta fold hydrolase [Psychrobacter sp.]